MCCLPSFFLKGRAKGRVRSAKPDRSLRREARALVVCGVCGAMRSQAQPAVGTTAETQSGSRVIQVPECTRDVHVVRALVSVWPSGVREKADRIVMRSLFSLLVVAAKPYTRTHITQGSEHAQTPTRAQRTAHAHPHLSGTSHVREQACANPHGHSTGAATPSPEDLYADEGKRGETMCHLPGFPGSFFNQPVSILEREQRGGSATPCGQGREERGASASFFWGGATVASLARARGCVYVTRGGSANPSFAIVHVNVNVRPLCVRKDAPRPMHELGGLDDAANPLLAGPVFVATFRRRVTKLHCRPYSPKVHIAVLSHAK